jgi:hypothetical protein
VPAVAPAGIARLTVHDAAPPDGAWAALWVACVELSPMSSPDAAWNVGCVASLPTAALNPAAAVPAAMPYIAMV